MTHKVNPWLVLVLVCLAQFMVVLDATIVNVALPTIQLDLKMTDTDLQWIVNAYTLMFGGFLLLGGRAGDLAGRKKIFLAGLVVFTTASLLCALAQGSTWLITTRGLQGLGAALVSPAALAIVTATFNEGSERTKALGVWAAIAVGGGAVGLVLGGILVDVLSWPWIFFVNVPVGLVTLALAVRFIPESRDEHTHKSFDLAGAVAVTGGLIALVYGIVRSSELGWGSGEVLGILALSAVLLVGFVVIEYRSAEPLVRLSIFSSAPSAVRTSGCSSSRWGSSRCSSSTRSSCSACSATRRSRPAWLSCRSPAGIILGSVASQSLIPRLGAREVPVIGLGIAVVGMLFFLRLSPDSTYVKDILPGIMLASIGMGLTFVPVTLIATSGMPVDDAGLASGLFNTSQQIGGALGLALLATFAANKTTDVLGALGHKPTDAEAAQALVDGFHVAWIGCAVFLAAGAGLLFALLRRGDVLAVAGGEADAVVT